MFSFLYVLISLVKNFSNILCTQMLYILNFLLDIQVQTKHQSIMWLNMLSGSP